MNSKENNVKCSKEARAQKKHFTMISRNSIVGPEQKITKKQRTFMASIIDKNSGLSVDKLYSNTDTIIKIGIVSPDKHSSDPSLYKIHIPDMTSNQKNLNENGIWCHNKLGNYTGFTDANNNDITLGSYFPLQPGMPVITMIPNGGQGEGIIIGPAKTNINVPDPENVDQLFMLAKTPRNSWVAIDDKTRNVEIMFENGMSSVVLGENIVSLEIGKGDGNSGTEALTSFSINSQGFLFKNKYGTMSFDDTGFSIGFDADEEGQDNASFFKVTRDIVELNAGKNMQFNAMESISTKAKKVTSQGIDENSITANQVKINGSQLTSIKGTQIELEGFWNVQLKGVHVGIQADVMLREMGSTRYSTFITQTEGIIGIMSTYAMEKNLVVPSVNAIGAFTNLFDTEPISSGYGATVAIAATTAAASASQILYEGLQVLGIAWLMKNPAIAAITKVLGTGWALAGSGIPSESPSKILTITKNKKDKKSINSGIATKRAQKDRVNRNLSVAHVSLATHITAAGAGTSSVATSSGNSTVQKFLESGITGNKEEGSKSSGNIIQLNTDGLMTLKNSVKMVSDDPAMKAARKTISGAEGYDSNQAEGQQPMCGDSNFTDGLKESQGAQKEAKGPFDSEFITGKITIPLSGGMDGDMKGGHEMSGMEGGMCGGGMGTSGGVSSGEMCSGGMSTGGASLNAGMCNTGGGMSTGGCSGNIMTNPTNPGMGAGMGDSPCGSSPYGNNPCPPGYYLSYTGICLKEKKDSMGKKTKDTDDSCEKIEQENKAMDPCS